MQDLDYAFAFWWRGLLSSNGRDTLAWSDSAVSAAHQASGPLLRAWLAVVCHGESDWPSVRSTVKVQPATQGLFDVRWPVSLPGALVGGQLKDNVLLQQNHHVLRKCAIVLYRRTSETYCFCHSAAVVKVVPCVTQSSSITMSNSQGRFAGRTGPAGRPGARNSHLAMITRRSSLQRARMEQNSSGSSNRFATLGDVEMDITQEEITEAF